MPRRPGRLVFEFEFDNDRIDCNIVNKGTGPALMAEWHVLANDVTFSGPMQVSREWVIVIEALEVEGTVFGHRFGNRVVLSADESKDVYTMKRNDACDQETWRDETIRKLRSLEIGCAYDSIYDERRFVTLLHGHVDPATFESKINRRIAGQSK